MIYNMVMAITGASNSNLTYFAMELGWTANWYLSALAAFMGSAILFNYVISSPGGHEPYLIGRYILAATSLLLYFSCYGFPNQAVLNQDPMPTGVSASWMAWTAYSSCPLTMFQRDNLASVALTEGTSDFTPIVDMIEKAAYMITLYGACYF